MLPSARTMRSTRASPATTITRQSPIGCQTVFISRNAAIHSGRSVAPIVEPVEAGVGHAARAARDALDGVRGGLLGGLPEVVRDPPPVDGVDVHVRGERWHELRPVAGEDVDDAARDVRGREHLGERDRGQRPRLRGEDDGDVAAREDGREPRHEAEERAPLGRDDADDASRLGDREVEVRGADGVRRAQHLGDLVRPARVPDPAIDRPPDGRPRPPAPRPSAIGDLPVNWSKRPSMSSATRYRIWPRFIAVRAGPAAGRARARSGPRPGRPCARPGTALASASPSADRTRYERPISVRGNCPPRYSLYVLRTGSRSGIAATAGAVSARSAISGPPGGRTRGGRACRPRARSPTPCSRRTATSGRTG